MPSKTGKATADRDDFTDYLIDALAELGPIEVKRFFGGKGLKLDQVLVGFVIQGTFWLRVDESGRAAMAAAGSGPFSYQRQGRRIDVNGYYAVPAAMLEDTDELIDWVRRAYHVAAIDREAKPPRPKKPIGGKASTPRRR
jgi:DNA transformation protein